MRGPMTAAAFVVAVALAGAAQAQSFSYGDYADALKTYVNDQGMVNYAQLKEHSEKLDSFLGSLAGLNRETYDGWTEPAKIAFWLNAYNACTLKAIIDHYPIQSSFFAGLRFPKNSIRQISGVWDKLKFPVMGRPMTLDGIEHGVLRKEFHEPRIHMALVCAAMGCPPLRNEPYMGDRLGDQLDDQARRFLSNPLKFRIDAQAGTVYLSPIFKWFGEDFVARYGVEQGYGDHSAVQRAVLHFIGEHLHKEDAERLYSGDYSISYLDYDWSLNEIQK
jgi:hypothetical protein